MVSTPATNPGTHTIVHSDTAIGFYSTSIKPFPIFQIKHWDCAESRLFHRRANNSCLMMQWRKADKSCYHCNKVPFVNTPDNTGHGPALFTVPVCLSLPPAPSVQFVLGIFVSLEPADLETLIREGENNNKISSQQAQHHPCISSSLSECFSSVRFAQRCHPITLEMFLLSLERPVQSQTKGN